MKRKMKFPGDILKIALCLVGLVIALALLLDIGGVLRGRQEQSVDETERRKTVPKYGEAEKQPPVRVLSEREKARLENQRQKLQKVLDRFSKEATELSSDEQRKYLITLLSQEFDKSELPIEERLQIEEMLGVHPKIEGQ
jgi:uncharacterized protein HemX